MSSWKECKLGDVAEIIGGGTPSTSNNEFWNGNIPWLTPRDLTGYSKVYISHGERFITESGLKNSSAKLMPKGSVLLTSRAPIGYVVIAENEICTNQGFKSLVPNFEILNSEFLYYWLKSNTDYLQQLGTGTTFAEISGSVVKNIDISLPPLEEQKAIAEVLSSLDDKIDLLHRQNQTLECLAQTLFRQWFIEEAKEEWEVGTVGDIAILKSGKSRPKEKSEINNIPIYGGNGILGFTHQHNVDGETIIIGRVGAYCGSLYIENKPIWVSDNALIAKPQNPLYSKYLFYILKENELNSMAEGSSHPLLTQEPIKSIEVFIPPKLKLIEFNEQVNIWYEKTNKNKKQIQTLENLRDTLLPKLLSGEVRVEINQDDWRIEYGN